MSPLLHGAKTVSLIGNGPVSCASAARIDDADLVIRFNCAPLCRVAGQRTDILVLNWSWYDPVQAKRGRPINRHALNDAREIWVRKIDRPEDRLLRDKPVFECEKDGREPLSRELAQLGAAADQPRPTLGLSALDFILRNSDARITLFGFTHQGVKMHSWDAERRWFEAKIAEGRVTRAPLDGPRVRLTLPMLVEQQSRRVFNHLRKALTR